MLKEKKKQKGYLRIIAINYKKWFYLFIYLFCKALYFSLKLEYT